VVPDSRDLIAIERTREYKGLYHVLGGVISPMNGIGAEQLHIRQLMTRVAKNKPAEVIFAISPSVEGEVTMHVVTDYLRQLQPQMKITHLAFGLPMGSDLEYADEVTLARALEARRDV
jgi:recombination protein RecR